MYQDENSAYFMIPILTSLMCGIQSHLVTVYINKINCMDFQNSKIIVLEVFIAAFSQVHMSILTKEIAQIIPTLMSSN